MGKKNLHIDFVKKIMDDVYENNERPKKADYEEAVAQYRNKNENPRVKYTKRSVHSAVDKAIDALVIAEEMLVIEDRFYIPNNYRYKLNQAKKYIRENVTVKDRNVLEISENLYAVKIDESQLSDKEHTKKIKEAFEIVLGAQYYNVAVVDNVILLMVYSFYKTDVDRKERAEFRKRVAQTIEEAWDYQHKYRLTKTKTQ